MYVRFKFACMCVSPFLSFIVEGIGILAAQNSSMMASSARVTCNTNQAAADNTVMAVSLFA